MKNPFNKDGKNKNTVLLIGLGLLGGAAALQTQRSIVPTPTGGPITIPEGPLFRTRFGAPIAAGSNLGNSNYNRIDFTGTASPIGTGCERTTQVYHEVRTILYLQLTTALPLATGESHIYAPIMLSPSGGSVIPLSVGVTLLPTTTLPIGLSAFLVLDSGWTPILNQTVTSTLDIGSFIASQRAVFVAGGSAKTYFGWVDNQLR